MKKIDIARAEIMKVTESVSGLATLGRRLAATNREDFAPNLRDGVEFEMIGQAYLAKQIELVMAYSPDYSLWQELCQRVQRLSNEEQSKPGVLFGEWSLIESSLGRIGEAFWHADIAGTHLDRTDFADRLHMVGSGFADLPPHQIEAMYKALGNDAEAGTGARSGGCYIATAVYGSYDAPAVMTLRQFRDQRLAASTLGRALIGLYYRVSPGMAKYFERATPLNWAARKALDLIVSSLERRVES